MAPLHEQRILVTGGSGFLGSHVVAALRARGGQPVVGPPSRECDLRDAAAVRALLADVRPELIFHLAGRVGGIAANARNPGGFFHDNMAMGLHVFEEARRAGVRKIVTVGTVCSYPSETPIPFREEDLWEGYPEETNAPYGVAKRALLVMAQAYRREYGSNYVMLIPANSFGPGDSFDPERGHVVPALIRRYADAQGDVVTLWGDGSPTRDFLYVTDAVEGILLAAERYDGPEPINLGTGVETSIRELAGVIAETLGFRGETRWDAGRPGGHQRRALDVSRAARLLGFRAGTSLADGIAGTVAWYRSQAR